MKNNLKCDRSSTKLSKGIVKTSADSIKTKRVSKRDKKTPSYADMANGVESEAQENNLEYPLEFLRNYPPTNVMRASSFDDNLYQDQPVDFSAKRAPENIS